MIALLNTLYLNIARKRGKNKIGKYKERADGGGGGGGSVFSKLPLNVRTLQGTLELIGAE